MDRTLGLATLAMVLFASSPAGAGAAPPVGTPAGTPAGSTALASLPGVTLTAGGYAIPPPRGPAGLVHADAPSSGAVVRCGPDLAGERLRVGRRSHPRRLREPCSGHRPEGRRQPHPSGGRHEVAPELHRRYADRTDPAAGRRVEPGRQLDLPVAGQTRRAPHTSSPRAPRPAARSALLSTRRRRSFRHGGRARAAARASRSRRCRSRAQGA
jgi:hypothetical protein